MECIIWTEHSRRCSTISGTSAGMTENRLGAGPPEERPRLGSPQHPLSHHLPLTSPTSPAVSAGLSLVALLGFSTAWRSRLVMLLRLQCGAPSQKWKLPVFLRDWASKWNCSLLHYFIGRISHRLDKIQGVRGKNLTFQWEQCQRICHRL